MGTRERAGDRSTTGRVCRELLPGMTGVSCHDGAVDAAAEVHQAAVARATALAAGDAKALRELLHEQFRWTTHVGQVFDRDEYIRRNTAGVTEWRSQTLGPTDISIVGEVAVLLTVVTDVVAATKAEDAKFRMPVTQVWVRSRGKWQCLAGHAGPLLGCAYTP